MTNDVCPRKTHKEWWMKQNNTKKKITYKGKSSCKNQLESYIFNVKQTLDEAGNKLSENNKSPGKAKCHEVLQWLECTCWLTKLHGFGAGQGVAAAGKFAGRLAGSVVPDWVFTFDCRVTNFLVPSHFLLIWICIISANIKLCILILVYFFNKSMFLNLYICICLIYSRWKFINLCRKSYFVPSD